MKVLILEVDDWEALYVDGKCVKQGHTLAEEGDKLFLLKMAEKYNFTSEDVKSFYLIGTNKDAQEVYDCGEFPDTVEELKNEY